MESVGGTLPGPAEVTEIAHQSAAILVGAGRATHDPEVTGRLVTLVDDPGQASREYTAGIRCADVAHAVAGIAGPPRPEELQRVADQILTGVFEGDLAVALERASAFCSVVAAGRAELAHDRDHVDPDGASDLTRTALAMLTTGEDLRACARLWRAGELD